MKEYKVEFADNAKHHIEKFAKAGNKTALKKIYKLVDELYEHPKEWTGKPEYLKYKKCWSRIIDSEHRLCYEIHDDVVIVLVVSAFGHYDNE